MNNVIAECSGTQAARPKDVIQELSVVLALRCPIQVHTYYEFHERHYIWKLCLHTSDIMREVESIDAHGQRLSFKVRCSFMEAYASE